MNGMSKEVPMRLEGLVPCLNLTDLREQRLDVPLPTLQGVFQRLPFIPTEFAVYCDLRPGAFDDGRIRVRCRQRKHVWYETVDDPIRFEGASVLGFVAWVYDTTPPEGRSVVEVLIGGSVAGSRLIDLKA
jgi:hypothetical protein